MRKAMIGISIVFLALIAGLVGADIYFHYQRTIEDEYLHMEKLAQVAEENISGSLRAIDLLMRDIATDGGEVHDIGEEGVMRTIRARLLLFPEVQDFVETDAKGIVVRSSLPNQIGADLSQRLLFVGPLQSQNRNRLFLEKPTRFANGARVLFSSRSKQLGQEPWSGVVALYLSPEHFTANLSKLRPAGNSVITLIDRTGDILARYPDPELLAGRNIAANENFAVHIASNQTVTRVRGRVQTDGQVKQLVLRTMVQYGLVVAVGRQADEVTAGWWLETLVKLAALSSLLVIASVCFWGFFRHEAQLRRSQKFAEQVVEDASILVVGLDEAGTLLMFNEAAEHLTGYPRAEVLGCNWFDLLVPPQHVAQALRDFRAWQSGQSEAHPVQTYIRTRDGRERLVAWRGSMIRDPLSAVTMVAFGIDITEQSAAEGELRRLSERLSLATKVSGIGVWEWDTTTETLLWDQRMRETYGLGSEVDRIAYQVWRSRVHPEDISRVEAEVNAALSNHSHGFESEYRIVRPDGAVRVIRAAGAVQRDARGRAVRMTGVNWDVTEANAAGRALADAKRQAENANRAKSDFVASMSHEIRTPMNAILGLGHLLLRTPLSPEQKDYVSKITASGRSLLGILNDILDFSKVEAGRLDLEEVDFNLGEVLDGLATVLTANASAKDIEILIGIDPKVPDRVRGDPLRLQQVLINLGGNAVKFTDHGEVVIQVDVESLSDNHVVLAFEVRDTGIGIPPEKLDQLFAPFTQADSSTSRRYGGTGLGLVISKRLVELMGGSIIVKSVPTRGSTFRFVVTCGLARGTAPAAKGLSPLRALIVDDNPTARTILLSVVRSLGWTGEAVAGGPAALGRLRATGEDQGSFDLVLLDGFMPEMDGRATARAIRTLSAGGKTPTVIMVTAQSRDELRDLIQEGLAAAVLTKPITPSTLHNAVAGLLARSEAEESGSAVSGGGAVGEHALPQPPTEGRLNGLRLLLVEDNSINQEVARRILELEGAEVTILGDGQQAVKLLERESARYDLVLMDVQMPVMDGFEATRRLRRIPALASLPVVALTAGAMASERERCLAVGMNDFIAKPLDVDQMVRVILRRCSRRLPHRQRLSVDVFRPHRAGAGPEKPHGSGASAPPMPEVPGLNPQHALRYFGSNPELYRTLLGHLATQCGGLVAEIQALLETGDHQTAVQRLHATRGAAANLGADGLVEALRSVETLLSEGLVADPVSPSSPHLAAALEIMKAEVETLLGALESKTPQMRA